MKILAVDTTGASASVAVQDTEKGKNSRIFCETSGEEMNHLQALFPMIEKALGDAGISKKELELIAVSTGPGSFTGIRIGMAAARTMAQALGLPMAAVPTLESFVYAERTSAPEDGEALEQSAHKEALSGDPIVVCPMLDARRKQVYAAAYIIENAARGADGGYREIVSAGAYDVSGFLALAVKAAEKEHAALIRMYGDGSDSYASAVSEAAASCSVDIEYALRSSRYQSAENVLMMACAMAQSGDTVSYSEVKPDYMRKSEAERKLEAGQLGKKTGKKKVLRKQQPAAENGMEIPAADEPVTYRNAEESDVSAFAALDARCFSHAWSEASFRGELDGSKKSCYIAAENSKGDIIGFAGAAYVVDEGEVNRVAVHPLYRGRGIADHMMDMLIESSEAQGIASLMLEVREANRSAIALYKSHGFNVEGKRDGYYAETGENALLMRRDKK